MSEKPEADVVRRHQTCQVAFEHACKRFAIHYGYKQRSDVQIRLEDNGDVYLSSSDETRRHPARLLTVTVPFKLFAQELPEFIKHLHGRLMEDDRTQGTSGMRGPRMRLTERMLEVDDD